MYRYKILGFCGVNDGHDHGLSGSYEECGN